MQSQLSESIAAEQRLLLAVAAYQTGSGHWPPNPQALQASSFVDETVGFDRFQNLQFQPLPDGRLVVRFDRWMRPNGKPGLLNISTTLRPEAERIHDP